ncbi:MAG: Spy/CpxP family protein refolding chaperone [Desulfobacterales bacterium]|nr:Spy/CpxP family protein refolding chaperone [Desulfobacterales bacterium]
MRAIKTLSMVLVLVMVFSGMAIAGKGGDDSGRKRGMKHHRGFGMGLKALLSLDLSDAQKTEVANILKKYQDDMKTAADKLAEAKNNMGDLIHADEFNEAEIRKAFQAASSIKEELVVLKAKIFSEIKPVLTPEQIETLEERKAKHAEKRKKHMDKRFSKLDSWIESHIGE